VTVTFDLDHQLRLRAIEVGDEAADRMLSTDLEAELTASNRLPDLVLGRGQRVTEVARALEDGRGDAV